MRCSIMFWSHIFFAFCTLPLLFGQLVDRPLLQRLNCLGPRIPKFESPTGAWEANRNINQIFYIKLLELHPYHLYIHGLVHLGRAHSGSNIYTQFIYHFDLSCLPHNFLLTSTHTPLPASILTTSLPSISSVPVLDSE